jgi:hypothetical protein
MDLLADRLGFQEVDSLHQADELVSQYAGYLVKVQSIRGNGWKTGETINDRNKPQINGLYDTMIETDRERDEKWSQFEGPKARCRSKRSFSIQSIIVALFPRCHPLFRGSLSRNGKPGLVIHRQQQKKLEMTFFERVLLSSISVSFRIFMCPF